jgi:hypothetical protein
LAQFLSLYFNSSPQDGPISQLSNRSFVHRSPAVLLTQSLVCDTIMSDLVRITIGGKR